MQWQLRRYEMREGGLEAFVREWRDHVLPLRRACGFEVLGPWIDEKARFVWIVGHDDFAAADRAYYDSAERRAIDPDPARHVAASEHVCMEDA
jgi:hypothetical protein